MQKGAWSRPPADPETGVDESMTVIYEQEVAPVRRSRRPVPEIVVVLLVILVGLAVLKPWSDGSLATGPSAAPIVAAVPVTSSAPFASAPSSPAPAALGPSSQAAPPAPGSVTRPSPETIALIVARFVKRAGAWGVGSGGSGPRMVRDDPWTDWAPVTPVPTGPMPDNLGVWPGMGICRATPILYDRPSLIAVTAPGGLTPDWRLVGWWTDGVATADLTGTIRQISPPGNRAISYLERTDGGPWPSGRYEFHVVSGEHQFALTVCLGQNGQA
jgi:hypothetical protein